MNLITVVCAAFLAFAGQQNDASGSITGVLKNSAGAPAAGVRVAAMAVPGVAIPTNEAAVFVSITQTDTAGRYRLADIPPGRYYITAGLIAAPTFYPGVKDLSASSIVTIASGSALSGYDFSAVSPFGVKVQGRVVISAFDTFPPREVSLRGTQQLQTSIGADGSFEFNHVPPGTYQLISFPISGTIARREVVVRTEDITGLELVAPSQALIPVRIVTDDGSPFPAMSWRVVAHSPGFTSTVSGYYLSLRLQDGQFQISLSGMPTGYALKSTKYGDMDISSTGLLNVDTSKPPADLVFTIASVPGK